MGLLKKKNRRRRSSFTSFKTTPNPLLDLYLLTSTKLIKKNKGIIRFVFVRKKHQVGRGGKEEGEQEEEKGKEE